MDLGGNGKVGEGIKAEMLIWLCEMRQEYRILTVS
jgi:hypothetical protein